MKQALIQYRERSGPSKILGGSHFFLGWDWGLLRCSALSVCRCAWFAGAVCACAAGEFRIEIEAGGTFRIVYGDNWINGGDVAVHANGGKRWARRDAVRSRGGVTAGDAGVTSTGGVASTSLSSC